MALLRHVHADLMRPPREDAHGKQGGLAVGQGVERFPLCEGAASAFGLGHDGHARFLRGMPAHGQGAFAEGTGRSAGDGQVGLVHLVRGKGFRKAQARALGERGNDKAGCILVKPVNNARTRPFLQGKPREAGDQPVDQGPPRAAGAGMHG